ncbi:MAG: ARMT1-like domain-containing protein [candidate division WOR-3 bacterium]
MEGATSEKLFGELLKTAESVLSEETNLGLLANLLVWKAYEVCGGKLSYFEGFKKACNQNASTILPLVKRYVTEDGKEEEMLKRAIKVACAANVSPIGGPTKPYSFEEIKNVVEGVVEVEIGEEPLKVVYGAKKIVYILDNAGEVGFDSVLIELLKTMGKEVVVFVKRAPFFEDASVDDVKYFSIEKLVDEVCELSGFPVEVHLNEYQKEILYSADLVISKGVGSYEALGQEKKGTRVLYLLKAKCAPLTQVLGVRLGEYWLGVEG